MDLANVWTAPGSYNWSVTNSDNGGKTCDQVVDISISRGLTVFGQIATTPWWAMPSDTPTTTLTSSASAGQTSVTVASTSGFQVNRCVRLQDGADGGSNVEAKQISTIPNSTTLTFTAPLQRGYSTGSNARCTQLKSPLDSNGQLVDERHKWPPDNQYATAFQSACQEVASHFSTRITWWEFWNEANDNVGWHNGSSGGSEYATWLVRSSNGVKAGNASAKVSVGGMLGFNANTQTWLNTVRSGAQSSYDGIGLHPYAAAGADPIDTAALDSLRSNMNSNGDGSKPILANEYGWKLSELNDSEATQAARVADALTKLRAGGPGWNLLMAAYNAITDVTGANFGLCSNASPNPQKRQAFFQFQAMAPSLTYKMPVVSVV
ncbi:MAG: hypothetical protein HY534_01865 [Chloroflexi bacterium]|nr:hypothetical protein [Chloroflexota bacterium]